MPSLKELREQAGETVAEMKKVRDAYNTRKSQRDKELAENKTPTVDLWPENEQQRWQELNQTHERLRGEIAEESRSEDLNRTIDDLEREAHGDRRHANPPGRDDFEPRFAGGDSGDNRHNQAAEQRDLALQAWFLPEELRRDEHRAAAKEQRLSLASNKLVLDLHDTRQFGALQSEFRNLHPTGMQRALSAHTPSTGAVMIGSTLVGMLERNMLAFGGVEQVATVMTTETGEEIAWPTADDTGNEGQMLGENPTSQPKQDPAFAAVKWFAYEFTSKEVDVPVRLLEDAPASFAGELGSMLGERLGRALNRKFTSGTGAAQPKGIVTAATLGKTAASATVIDPDELINLEHSVDPAYRREPGGGFMLHDSVIEQLRLLKDLEGRYLWRSGLQDNRPDSLLGYPITINQQMDSAVAAENKVVLFGAFRRYKVRRVRQVVVLRLRERKAELRQEVFIAFVRADGNLLDAGTAPIKYLQMAA